MLPLGRLSGLLRPMNDRPRWEIVLKALMKGAVLEYQGKRWRWSDGYLCVEMQPTTVVRDAAGWSHSVPVPGDPEPHRIDMLLSVFLTWCEKIPQGAMDKLVFAGALIETPFTTREEQIEKTTGMPAKDWNET